LLAETSDTAAGTGGTLRVGFTATTDMPPLSRLLAAFQQRHPGCQVATREVDSADPYAALRRGDVDVLVNWLACDEPDLTTGPAISLHDRVLVVARNHRLRLRRDDTARSRQRVHRGRPAPAADSGDRPPRSLYCRSPC